jgi:TetR/AcrR family transcriptional regulator, transcriptional repressor of bet genes
MSADRRTYRREPEAKRKQALIEAAQALVAEGGPQAATVRAIADRAGVTAGLIRHYFTSKEDLTRAAYLSLMFGMVDDNAAVLAEIGNEPDLRLAAFVAATLRPPVISGPQVGLWAAFIQATRRDPALLEAHEVGYLRYRDQLQELIAALPHPADAARLRAEAIACNAVIDGLWLEGSILPHAFGSRELQEIGLRSVGAIVGVDLMKHAERVIADPEAEGTETA